MLFRRSSGSWLQSCDSFAVLLVSGTHCRDEMFGAIFTGNMLINNVIRSLPRHSSVKPV